MTNSDQPIINPGQGIFKIRVAERIIFVPVGVCLRLLALRLRAKKTKKRAYPAQIYRLKEEKEINLAGPAMGAPVAGMVLEQLIAGGARRIIFIGLAGAISPNLDIGDLLLVNEAISDEGTSKDYFPEKNPPRADDQLFSRLNQELEKTKKKFKIGKVATIDAFFRETPKKIKQFQNQGAIAVEMELSALYTIARFRKVALAGMVIISDEHKDNQWKTGFTSPKLLSSLIDAGKIARKVLSQ